MPFTSDAGLSHRTPGLLERVRLGRFRPFNVGRELIGRVSTVSANGVKVPSTFVKDNIAIDNTVATRGESLYELLEARADYRTYLERSGELTTVQRTWYTYKLSKLF